MNETHAKQRVIPLLATLISFKRLFSSDINFNRNNHYLLYTHVENDALFLQNTLVRSFYTDVVLKLSTISYVG